MPVVYLHNLFSVRFILAQCNIS